MNAAKTILEGLFGCRVESTPNAIYVYKGDELQGAMWETGLAKWCEIDLTQRHGSVQKAAEEAAEYRNKKLARYQWIRLDSGDWGLFHEDQNEACRIVSALDLIAEAVQAGWEG